jgi:uncharacterized membrane protein
MGNISSVIRGIATDRQFLILILFLASMNASVFLDLVFYRQVLGLVALTLLPGYLIARSLRLDRFGKLKGSLISFGLGLSFLMFFGLFVNIAYFSMGYVTPLDSASLTVSMSITLVFLFLIARRRCGGKVFPTFSLTGQIRQHMNVRFLFPIIFPLLAICGTQLIDATSNNLVLLALLFLIIVYSISLIISKPKNPSVYPFSLWMISLASIFMLSLRSDHILGYDVYWEYQISDMTLRAFHWIPASRYGPLNANLSVGLLPAMFSSVSGVNLEYVYKTIFALIFSITPVIVFAAIKGYLGSRFAFAASLFFVFQSTFAFVSQSSPRTAIALVFFALAIMILFEKRVEKSKRMLLAIVFMSAVMFSHYATTFIFLIILVAVTLESALHFKRLPSRQRVMGFTLPLLFFAMIFFWYGEVTGPAFAQGVRTVQEAFENLGSFFLLESRHEGTMRVMGVGVTSIPDMLYSIDYYLMAAVIGFGVLGLTYRMISKRKVHDEYAKNVNRSLTVMMIVCSSLLVGMILLPAVSNEYTMDRLWTQMLILLSGAFVLGCIFLSANKRRRATLLIAILLIVHFSVASGLAHQSYGIPKSMVINSNGPEFSHFYIRNDEIAGAEWLGAHMDKDKMVFTDFDTSARVAVFGKIPRDWYTETYFSRGDSLQGEYLFLGYYNVAKAEVNTGEQFKRLAEFQGVLDECSLVYDNAGSRAYI